MDTTAHISKPTVLYFCWTLVFVRHHKASFANIHHNIFLFSYVRNAFVEELADI